MLWKQITCYLVSNFTGSLLLLFSGLVMFNCLQPHGMQHAKLPYPLPISWSLLKLMSIELMMPSNNLNLCHSLLLLPSNFPSTRGFPMSRLFPSDGQSIEASSLASVLPVIVQGRFPSGVTGLITLQSKTLSSVFSSTTF